MVENNQSTENNTDDNVNTETETSTEREQNQTTAVQPQAEESIKGNQTEGEDGLLTKSEEEREAKDVIANDEKIEPNTQAATQESLQDSGTESIQLRIASLNSAATVKQQIKLNVNGTTLTITVEADGGGGGGGTDPDKPKEYERINYASNKVSSTSVDGINIPANVGDDSSTTRFSGVATMSNPCELEIELDNTEPLAKFEIDFFRDEIRKEKYAIALSSDLGKTYYATENIVLKEDVHTIELSNPMKITNFKLIGYGNIRADGTTDNWLSVTGIRLYKIKGAASEPLPDGGVNPKPEPKPEPNGKDLLGFNKLYPDSTRKTAPKEFALGTGDYRERLDSRASLRQDTAGNTTIQQDGKTRVNIYPTKGVSDGAPSSFKQGEAIKRGYMVQEEEWRDIEVTEVFNGAFGGDDKTTYARSAQHTGSNDQRGSAYKVSMSSKGARCGKEQLHAMYDYHKDGWVKKAGFPSFEGIDITTKVIMYNIPNTNGHVAIELWVEKTFGKQDFALYHRWVDDGTYWGGDEDIGGRKARDPISYSGLFVTLRTDAGKVTIKKLDVREIDGKPLTS